GMPRPGVDYVHRMWQGAEERAQALGYRLETFWLAEPGMSGRRLSAILAARGIRGLLIPPLSRSCGHLSINWDEFAAVSLSNTIGRPVLNRAVPDQHQPMQLILRKMRHRAYLRPGLLLPAKYDDRVEHRASAAFHFHQQMRPRRHRVPVLLCRSPHSDRD